MADAKTLMSLSLRDLATRQLKSFESNYKRTMKSVESTDIGDVDKALGALSGGLGGLGTVLGIGGVTAGLYTIGSAINDMATQAGQLELVRGSFEGLAATAGQSADAMLAAMRRASGGMVSDYDLILAANKAMLLGVADTGDELAALLEVARSRGQAMGLSLTQAFNDIVTGLGRESALILDNLGITVDLAGTMDRYAATLGTTADKLDGAQRKQALLNEVMRQSASITPATTGNIASAQQQAEAAAANASAAAGAFFAPIMREVEQGKAQLFQMLAGTYDEYAAKLQGIDDILADASGDNMSDAWTQRFIDLRNAMQVVGEAMVSGAPIAQTYATTLSNIANEAQLNRQITDQQAQSIRTIATLTQDAIKAQRQYEQAVAAATAAFQAQYQPLAYLGTTVQELTASQEANRIATEQAAQAVSGFGRVAAAGAADVAALDAAVAGLNARMAGMQPILSSVQQMRQSAVSQAESLGLQAIAEGADPAQVAAMVAQVSDEVWNLGLSYDATTEAQFLNRVEVDKATQGLEDYVGGLRESNRAAAALATGGLAQMDQAVEGVRNRVAGIVGQSLSLDAIGVNPADFLPRPDAVQEDAFRLADVMVNGFASPWAAYFESTFPALFKEMTANGDIQAGAAAILQQFQQGMRPELLNFDAIKEQVKQALAMDDAIAGIRDQITAELTGQGASAAQVQGALNSVLGSAGLSGGSAPDLSGAGGSAGSTFIDGFGEKANGGILATKVAAQITAVTAVWDGAGRTAGSLWGTGFTAVVDSGVGPYIVDMLVRLVTPGVMAAIAAQGSAEGPL